MPAQFYDKPILTKEFKNFNVEEYKVPSIAFSQKITTDTYINYNYPSSKKWNNNNYKFLCTTTVQY